MVVRFLKQEEETYSSYEHYKWQLNLNIDIHQKRRLNGKGYEPFTNTC